MTSAKIISVKKMDEELNLLQRQLPLYIDDEKVVSIHICLLYYYIRKFLLNLPRIFLF